MVVPNDCHTDENGEKKKKAMPNLSITIDLPISTRYDMECSKVIILLYSFICSLSYVNDRQAHVLISYLLYFITSFTINYSFS